MMIVPIGSICAIGFRVSLPSILAVGSPSLFAANPCDSSWKTIAIKIGNAEIMICRAMVEISKILYPFSAAVK